MKDYYEIYCTIHFKSKKESYMTIHVWEDSERNALLRAEMDVRKILQKTERVAVIDCEILSVFPHTLEEFVYEALKESLSGRRKKQGMITLKDMNQYMRDALGIKNNAIKEIAASIIMDQDTDGAVAYFKDFLGIAENMFMGRFGLTREQLLEYEKQGRLEFAYEEGYGDKKTRYYKPDVYYQENI